MYKENCSKHEAINKAVEIIHYFEGKVRHKVKEHSAKGRKHKPYAFYLQPFSFPAYRQGFFRTVSTCELSIPALEAESGAVGPGVLLSVLSSL